MIEKSNRLKTQRHGSHHQVIPSLDLELVPRLGWEDSKSQAQPLLPGQAEMTFFAMRSVVAASSNRVTKERSPVFDNNCEGWFGLPRPDAMAVKSREKKTPKNQLSSICCPPAPVLMLSY